MALSMGPGGPGAPMGMGPPGGTAPGPGPGSKPDPKVYKKWICIYSVYIDCNKKVSEGRRLPLHKLVGCK
jgi:hypothetical protein